MDIIEKLYEQRKDYCTAQLQSIGATINPADDTYTIGGIGRPISPVLDLSDEDFGELITMLKEAHNGN